MIKSRYISVIVVVAMCLALLGSLWMVQAADTATAAQPEYQKKLFNGEIVSVDIQVAEEDWQSLLDNAQSEEYISADILLNGDRFSTIGIRTKGNSSLSQVASSDSDRYSLQLNPDKYVKGQSFYGLDTMCLNNILGDATYMKDAISYSIMQYLDVPSPLYNYANVTINGEPHGVFLLLERYDDSFLDRVYNATKGELYNVKMTMGGGDFDKMPEFGQGDMGEMPQMPEGGFGFDGQMPPIPEGEFAQGGEMPVVPGQLEGAEEPAESVMPEVPVEDSQNAMPQVGAGPKDEPMGERGAPPQNGMAPNGGAGAMPPMQAENSDGMATPAGEENPIAKPAIKDAVEEDGAEAAVPPQLGGNGGGPPEDMGDGPGGMGGVFSGGGSLLYTDDNPDSYSSIFENAVSSKVSDNDKSQMIEAIKVLNNGEKIEQYWDVDEILRYLSAHTFVVNLDSYVSGMQQNYYLLERDGVVSVLPWDYNLAFGGYTSRDAADVVNFAIDTPVSGVSMEDRPLVNQLLSVEEYAEKYHGYLRDIVEGYVNSGLLAEEIQRIDAEIGEYVKTDATAFYTYEEYQAALPVFEELINLRAQSVAGQLDGTIPSTTEGQQADKSALVDASSVSLSTLGSMGGGMGPKRQDIENNVVDGVAGATLGATEEADKTKEEFAQQRNDVQLPQENRRGDGDMVNVKDNRISGNRESNAPMNLYGDKAMAPSDWILAGVLASSWLASILFVVRFRRRKWM